MLEAATLRTLISSLIFMISKFCARPTLPFSSRFAPGSAPPAHFISGVEIPLVNSTRDLGVLITDTLLWSDHIHLITSKAYKMLGLIRRSFSNTLSVFNKKSLYVSLVVLFSHLETTSSQGHHALRESSAEGQ